MSTGSLDAGTLLLEFALTFFTASKCSVPRTANKDKTSVSPFSGEMSGTISYTGLDNLLEYIRIDLCNWFETASGKQSPRSVLLSIIAESISLHFQ